MSVELDYMEYANDAAAQAAYVSSDDYGAVETIDFYSEANQDEKEDIINGWDGDYSARGQAFTAPKNIILTSAKFYLKKWQSPTGTGYARLYAATGTVGTNAKPTGPVLASSAGFDVSALSADTYALITFDFSGDPYELQNGVGYVIVFEAPSGVGGGNNINVGTDGSSPSHAGNPSYYAGGWQSATNHDICFYVYGQPIHFQSFSESILKTQGSYSLKGIAMAQSVGACPTDLINEDCADISDWDDDDTANGVSEVSPAGQFRMDCNAAAPSNRAERSQDVGEIPDTFTVEIKLYHDNIGLRGDNMFALRITSDDVYFLAHFDTAGLWIHNGAAYVEVGTDLVQTETWQTWRFVVDITTPATATADVYLDDVYVGTADCSLTGTFTDGDVVIQQQGNTVENCLTHIDYIKLGEGLFAPFPTLIRTIT